MAKDPAFLFYPNDWLGGTMYLTHEQKGCYLELLVFQFNNGKFTLTHAKQVLGICFDSAWPMLVQKFKTDGKFFWNERLFIEIERRKKFSDSRRTNALSIKNKKNKGEAYAKHMETETENTNETINKTETDFGKSENLLTWDSVKNNFHNDFRWKEKFCREKKIEMQDLEKLMSEYISDTELREDFKSLKELKNHFVNTFKRNGTHKPILNGQKLGTSAARIRAAKNF